MRINQLQNLCWAGNVLVFAGMAWVGLQFYESFQAQKDVAEIRWPEAEPPDQVSSWPPAMAQFAHIHLTPIDGLVPAPPEVVVAKPVERDPWLVFSAKLVLMTGMQYGDDPARSSAKIKLGGEERTLSPGQMLEKFKFVSLYRVSKKAPGETDQEVLVFQNVETGSLHTKNFPIPVPPVLADGGPIDREVDPNSPFKPVVDENRVETQTFPDRRAGCFRIPFDEIRWWRVYGHKGFEAAGVTAQKAEGPTRAGVLFTRSIDSHPTLRKSRGIAAGDLVVAVDGKAVTEPAEVLRCFQGEDPFELTILRGGEERKERYVPSIPPRPTVAE